MNDKMNDKVKAIAELRSKVVSAGLKRDERQDIMSIFVEGLNMNKLLQSAINEVQMLEDELTLLEVDYKEDCMVAYNLDMDEVKNKQFPGGVVKVFKTFAWETDVAIQHAIDHNLPKLLKENKPAIKKAANILGLDFVTEWKEARMTLASDLSKFLEE